MSDVVCLIKFLPGRLSDLSSVNMVFQTSSIFYVILYIVVLVAFVDAAIPIAPKVPVPVPKPAPHVPEPVPVTPPEHNPPQEVTPNGPQEITPVKPPNEVGGSRSGQQTLPKLEGLPRLQGGISKEDDASVFSFDSFDDNQQQALFESRYLPGTLHQYDMLTRL